MDQPTNSPFTLDEWAVDPNLGTITRGAETIRLEPRTMRLLVSLSERAGEVVSSDDLLDRVWPNVIVTPDSVYQAVAALRRLLGDDPKNPRYVVTVPKQGYRMVAKIGALQRSSSTTLSSAGKSPPSVAGATATVANHASSTFALAAVGALAIAASVYAFVQRPSHVVAPSPISAAIPNPRSIAVMPFLDLTEAMGEEVFADGMTEELIDKIAKIPGVRVPPPTASFWFKDKDLTIPEIASKLDVAYIVDGSVRKSGAMLRVAARLVRASDGFVVWSETYDRPPDDKLMIQDNIASAVGKALESTIDDHTATTAAAASKNR